MHSERGGARQAERGEHAREVINYAHDCRDIFYGRKREGESGREMRRERERGDERGPQRTRIMEWAAKDLARL